MRQYVKREGITLKVTSGPDLRQDDDGWEHWAYAVTMRRPGAKAWAKIAYRMGTAHTAEPQAEEVFDSLILDATSGALDFDDFCSEFGYDTDSRWAEATWKACQAANRKMREFLGSDEFERVANEVERL